jgi:hypothetical protein
MTESLRQDDRFEAAWLTGSYGRGEADAYSDLDLAVVVAAGFVPTLCDRPAMVQGGTIPARLALISQFGQPAVLHENHYNAPSGGTMTFALYAETGGVVDWVLMPRESAKRPVDSRLLFDKVGIPVETPVAPDMSQRQAAIAEKTAFFWMMQTVTLKYIARRDSVKVQGLLETLAQILYDLDRMIAGEVWRYHRGSRIPLQTSQADQLALCLALRDQMLAVYPSLAQLGITLPPPPTATIDHLLQLHHDS